MTEQSVKKLSQWLEQTSGVVSGKPLTPSDLVSWLIERTDERLCEADIKAIKKRFFDPLKALEHATAKMKVAIEEGQEIDFPKFIREQVLTGETKEIRKQEKTPKKKKTEITQPESKWRHDETIL